MCDEVVCFQNDYVQLQVFKDEIERKMKNTHIDTAQYESEINRLTKENNELKRKLQGTDKVSIYDYITNLLQTEA